MSKLQKKNFLKFIKLGRKLVENQIQNMQIVKNQRHIKKINNSLEKLKMF